MKVSLDPLAAPWVSTDPNLRIPGLKKKLDASMHLLNSLMDTVSVHSEDRLMKEFLSYKHVYVCNFKHN